MTEPRIDPYSKDEIVFRTCQLVVRHIRNHVEENREGIHTRLFSHFLHPETEFVLLGHSPEALASPRDQWHLEHIVPCTALIVNTRRLIEEGRLPDDEISRLLQRHWKLAYITKKQANHLDHELKLKWDMPAGWDYEAGDTLHRLKIGHITIERRSMAAGDLCGGES